MNTEESIADRLLRQLGETTNEPERQGFEGLSDRAVTEIPEKYTPTETVQGTESVSDRLLKKVGTFREEAKAFNYVPTNKGVFNVEDIVKEYGRPLVKEDFMNDDRLQELVISNLEARFKPSQGGFDRARRGATAISGGVIGGLSKDYRNMDFEDVFETWQNYQRSFAGGQSVTTGNEMAYALSGDEATQATLGSGYLLFDSMDNAFTGEGSWSEMFDAVGDYAKAAVFDPTTILSFGIGKALSAGSTRAGAVLAKKTAVEAMKRAAQKGVPNATARAVVGKAAAAAPYMAPDLVFNVGADIANQVTRIETGAQKDYSTAQTGLAAAATMALPAIAGGVKALGAARQSDLLKNTVVGYQNLDESILSPGMEEAWKQSKKVVNKATVNSKVKSNFETADVDKFLKWEDAKKAAKDVVNAKGERLTDDELMNAFENFFWFGAKAVDDKSSRFNKLFSKKLSDEQGGFFNALRDSGFVVHKDMLDADQKISGVYGQAIKEFLDDETVEASIKAFENATGRKLNLDYTAEGLSAHLINRASEAGGALNIKSRLATLEKSGLTGEELARVATGAKKIDDAQWGQFGLSVYKRLITSHLSTTGANIKGFAQIVSLNTAADFASSAVYAAQWAAAKGMRDPAKAAMYGNKAWGSLLAPLRKGAAVLSPDLEFDYAMKILDANPEVIRKLYREVGADGGVREAAEAFGLDGSAIAGGIDKVTSGVQALTLVRMQDELTKTWAFGANVDTLIMKEFGMTPTKFYSQPNVSTTLASPKYQNVLEQAARRTLRETMSVNWSSLPATGAMRKAATVVETITNKTPLGFAVPFGGFMNSVIATAGDLSGINATRRLVDEMAGRKVDYLDGDFGELMGKAAVGWTAVGLGIPAAMERIKNGQAYYQEETDSGELKDIRYDWPRPAFNLISQIMAHGYVGDGNIENIEDVLNQIGNGERDFDIRQVPKELFTELLIQVGPGQAARDVDDIVRGLNQAFAAYAEDPDAAKIAGDVVGSVVARVIQGVTRPLDPINTAVGLASGGNMNPDLKQGPEFASQAMRYMNQLFPETTQVNELPRRADPLRGGERGVDIGKQLLGNRTSKAPSIAEAMFQSAGLQSWQAVRWGGPAVVKNYMDTLAAPVFEEEAVRMLKSNPDFFDKKTSDKLAIIDEMRGRVKERVNSVMESGGLPRTLNYVRKLSEANSRKVTEVKNFLGYEGELEDIAKEEDGFDKLMKIKYFVDNYDDIFPDINR